MAFGGIGTVFVTPVMSGSRVYATYRSKSPVKRFYNEEKRGAWREPACLRIKSAVGLLVSTAVA